MSFSHDSRKRADSHALRSRRPGNEIKMKKEKEEKIHIKVMFFCLHRFCESRRQVVHRVATDLDHSCWLWQLR